MRRLLGRAVLACAVALLAVGPAAASAADKPAPSTPVATTDHDAAVDPDELAAVLKQVRSELAESSEQMVRAAADLRLADQALPGARATAEQTRTLLAAAQRRQAETALHRGQAQVRYMLSTREAEQTAAEVTEQQAKIGRLARAVYQGGGSLGNVSMLLDARSPADFAERLVALQTVVSSQRSVLDDLETVQQSFGEQTDDLEQVRDELAAADEQAQKDLRTVAALAEQARAAEARVDGLVDRRKAALAAAAAAQVQDDVAHAHQVGESTQLQAELAAQARRDLGPAAGRDGATVPARPGTLAWPVRGPITSPFGMRVHPVTGVYKLHTGADIGASCGTPIQAARDGLVIQAGWNSAYGWRTVVTHGVVDGLLLTTTYNHQTALGVAVGDRVTAGQQIGTVGSTGYSTGCHMHFELYVNSALVDPVPWLPAF
jgi:murein DD-endopeptidase MepM/ murein hydrolase activator NlpD